MRNRRIMPGRAVAAQTEPGSSYIRILHTVPTVPPVDVYAGDELVAKNLSYGNYSNYTKITPGNVTFKVYPTGTTDEIIGILALNIPDQSVFTIAGIGVPGKLGILQVPEAVTPTTPGNASFLRFINLASDVPPLNVSVAGGPTIFENIGYKELSLYHKIAPGDYTMRFESSASGLSLFDDLNISLQPGTLYTIYTVGYNTDGQKRKAIIAPEGNLNQVSA